jgi:hypothetical protein
MQEALAAIILILMGIVGGLLHAIVPPAETRPKELLVQVVAGVLVAIFYGPVLVSLDEMQGMGVLESFALVGPMVIGTSYWAMDILKVAVERFKPRS